jgi:hypothetical protein
VIWKFILTSNQKALRFLETRGCILKAYLRRVQEDAFSPAANISSRALNLPPYSNYNYEIGTIVEDLGIDDRLLFQHRIESDSILITDNIYNQIK